MKGAVDKGGNDTSATQWADLAASLVANEILFCGYRYDPETGLYHVRNRMYHPMLGRWLQRDPIEYKDGMNLYGYGMGNPVNRLDPQGTVVVILTGLGEDKGKGAPLGKGIEAELGKAIKNTGLDSGTPTIDVKLEGGGFSGPEKALQSHYEAFVRRKENDPCSLESFAAVGHSDGATGIYRLLNSGKFNGSSTTRLWTPAVLVTVDLARVHYLALGNTNRNETKTVTKPAGTGIGNFRQTIGEPFGWKGMILQGASINVNVNQDATIPGLDIPNPMQGKKLDHFGIFYDPAARSVYSQVVAKAYVWYANEEKQAKLLEPGRFHIPPGSDLSKKNATW
jgi:RHS repeat-associated protein